MIYPIIGYGMPVLQEKAQAIQPGIDLSSFIENMMKTLRKSKGVGLAAPQINKTWQLFVADFSSFSSEKEFYASHARKIYINPIVEIPEPAEWIEGEEGCLSLPGIYAKIKRSKEVRIKFFDEYWKIQMETWQGMPARVIQHEYDHLQGKLILDHLDKRQLNVWDLQIQKIKLGKVRVEYPMEFVS